MIRLFSAFAFASMLLPALAAAGPYLVRVASADGNPTFLIPARDGYGVAECLSRGDTCAVQVANAWCAAQGYHHAVDARLAVGENDQALTDAIAITCYP